MKKDVSVIIPTLDEEKNIENCVNSLVNQTEMPLEILIIDNKSKDKTIEIAKKLKQKLRKKAVIRIFHCYKGNQTDARELGVKKSKGDIIGSIDADAIADKDWISEIKKNFKNPNIAGIGGRSKFRNKGFLFNFFYFFNYYLRLIFRLYCIGGGNSAFRKSVFFSVRGYNGLEKLRKEKNIQYAKDDFFLSKKLEQKGKLKYCSDLNVSLLSRVRIKNNQKNPLLFDILKRVFLEIVYDYKITNYFKKLQKKPRRSFLYL